MGATRLSLIGMCGSESFWHGGLHPNSHSVGPHLSENAFNLRNRARDCSVSLSYNERVRRKFKEVFEESLRGFCILR